MGEFCIDRWEASMVDRESGRPLSPFYPPHPALLAQTRVTWEARRHETGDEAARAMSLPDPPSWQLGAHFEPKAVSVPGVVPSGYLSMRLAEVACRNAGKRLCKEAEWTLACEGAERTRHPYGARYGRGKCNVHRALHPAFLLHGDSSAGHRDPRLNLVREEGEDPLLRLTGATRTCASRWGGDAALDMVGNLDEWIDDPAGVFVGGFYARATTKGCRARISAHSPSYYDYSTGTRCCSVAKR